MQKTPQLSKADRDFFTLLADVIFSNPFSFDRDQLETSLGGPSKSTTQPAEHHYDAIVPALEKKIAQLESNRITRIQAVDKKDQALLEYAFLFQIYHRYVDDFDALIQTQIKLGEEPASVPFGRKLLGELDARGIKQHDANRYIALFYQFRRAHYFIARSLIGDSPAMRRLRHALWNNVFTRDVRAYANHLWDRMEDFSTLLLGETGTGKGSAASAIGRSGLIPFDQRTGRFKFSFTQTFIAINLSQFSESLIESELFGHRKGAFTGAIEHHQGIFERCSRHGALFLDEIGDISVPIQIKLLNVIQERSFSPVGSHERKRFAGRVIAATNHPLDTLRAQGRFRDDFYYRLSSDVIDVPSLHTRLSESPGELSQLLTRLIERLTGEPNPSMVEHVYNALERHLPANYTWPGNVRELEQAVRRIIINGKYSGLTSGTTSKPTWFSQTTEDTPTAKALLARYCLVLYEQYGSYEDVAERAELDRRTVKKYIQSIRETS